MNGGYLLIVSLLCLLFEVYISIKFESLLIVLILTFIVISTFLVGVLQDLEKKVIEN